MANRVLRDWTDSENIDKLSFMAESFFVRLFMKADDFGYFHANPKLLKANLFPLKDFREADVSRCLIECQAAGLIAIFEVEQKKYLIIKNFNQRLRKMVSKFPKFADNPLTIGSNMPPEKKQNPESETESEIEKKRILIEEKIQEILNSERWIQDSARLYGFETETTKQLLVDFLTAQTLKEEVEHRTIKEIKSHFLNVLKKEKEKTSAKKESNGKQIIGTKSGQQHPLQSITDLANGVLQGLASKDS